ncbi:MAG TPA: FGGY family carbohydrate kinase [Acidothermaceae bacterium]|jgi:xylulokinase
MNEVVIGLDIGTSSTKAVAVRADGTVVATVRGEHGVDQPHPGWFEQDAERVWWEQSAGLLRKLMATDQVRAASIAGIAVSGMGPCLLVCGEAGEPLRPGILYGIDTRATAEIAELNATIGPEQILARGGSALSSQAIGPKLLWVQRNEPAVWAATAKWFTTSSFLVHRLTDRYVLDHHTASQCDPMYDLVARKWAFDWASELSPGVELPELVWSDDVAGTVTPAAAALTGLPVGTPVLGGTVDAWAEAHSVGVRADGDLMLMYGSTMFMVGIDAGVHAHPGLWRTVGVSAQTTSLAAGMATSGLLTTWIADLTGRKVTELAIEAETIQPGSDGLVLLPYFAGERSPVFDPGARGVALGLTLAHTAAHWMRAAYEAIAMGVRHNLEAFDMSRAAGTPWRAVAVGGGAAGQLWPQIVSDVTGRVQYMPEQTIGACYGDALMAATTLGLVPEGTDWTRISREIIPRPELAELYQRRYEIYRELYPATRQLIAQL